MQNYFYKKIGCTKARDFVKNIETIEPCTRTVLKQEGMESQSRSTLKLDYAAKVNGLALKQMTDGCCP